LFVQLMLTRDGPKVVEFNCRFGDPECQAILAPMDGDLLPRLLAVAMDAPAPDVPTSSRASVCVTLASRGYPGAYSTGLPITGVDEAAALGGVEVFHAGTAVRDARLVTAGGRVLGVTAVADDVASAIERAYQAVDRIRFEGMHFRKDIGRRRAVAA